MLGQAFCLAGTKGYTEVAVKMLKRKSAAHKPATCGLRRVQHGQMNLGEGLRKPITEPWEHGAFFSRGIASITLRQHLSLFVIRCLTVVTHNKELSTQTLS